MKMVILILFKKLVEDLYIRSVKRFGLLIIGMLVQALHFLMQSQVINYV